LTRKPGVGIGNSRFAKAAVQDYLRRSRPEWTLKHPAQLVVITSQIYWSSMIEDALKVGDSTSVEVALVESLEICINQLEALSVLVRGELKSLERKILCALITIDVHARDIVDDMIRYIYLCPSPSKTGLMEPDST
jgi:dynein heavy chain